MSVRVLIVTCLLAGGAIAAGCSSAADSPTSPRVRQGADASQGATRPPQPPRPDPPPAAGTCVASQVQRVVGQPASRALLERARLAATATTARFIRPNEVITTEYSAGRLNLYLDARDVVVSAVCG